MKKFTKIISAAALILCGVIVFGCEDLKDEFEGPKNMWLEKEVTYNKTGGDGGAKATVYLYYTDDENPSISELNSDIELKAGLNIIFVPDAPEGSETASNLYSTFKAALNESKEPYAVFNLEKNVEASIADDTSESPFKIKMTDAKWTAFCIANPKTKNSATKDVPYPLCHKSYANVDITKEDIKALFSWRQLLIMLLQD